MLPCCLGKWRKGLWAKWSLAARQGKKKKRDSSLKPQKECSLSFRTSNPQNPKTIIFVILTHKGHGSLLEQQKEANVITCMVIGRKRLQVTDPQGKQALGLLVLQLGWFQSDKDSLSI